MAESDSSHETAPAPEAPTPGEPAPPAEGPVPSAPAPPEEDWAKRYRYLLAEFDNYRKRTDRERELLRRDNRAALLRELLPFHDALEEAHRAAAHGPSNDPFRRGLELLRREWERFLEQERVERVAEVGAPFRPEEEEAVGELDPRPGQTEGSVAEVVQQGYRSPAGLLRTAKVLVVGKGRPASAPPPGPARERDVPEGIA